MKSTSDIPLTQNKPTVCLTVSNKGQSPIKIGFGQFGIVFDEDEYSSDYYIQVRESHTLRNMLHSRLSPSINYQRQSHKIIWKNSSGSSYQLIFQSEDTCNIYWNLLCEKIGKNLQVFLTDLPIPDDKNLGQILQIIKMRSDSINHAIANSEIFLPQLCNLWQEMVHNSQKYNVTGPTLIISIVKALLSSNEIKIVQKLMSNSTFNLVLAVYKSIYEIDTDKLYTKAFKIKTLIQLPQKTINQISIVLNCIFFQEHILTYETNCNNQILLSILNIIMSQKANQIVLGVLKCAQFAKLFDIGEQRIAFLTEMLILSYKGGNRGIIKQLYSKIFNRDDTQSLIVYQIAQGNLKAIQLMNLAAKSDIQLFVENCRQQVGTEIINLRNAMVKGYFKGSEQTRTLILQTLKTIRTQQEANCAEITEFIKQSILIPILKQCDEPKALSDIIVTFWEDSKLNHNLLNGILHHHCLSRILQKQRIKSKHAKLSICKILKLCLSSQQLLTYQMITNLFKQMVQSGFILYCLNLMRQQIERYHHNRPKNIIFSALMQSMKSIEHLQCCCIHQEIYHYALQNQQIYLLLEPIVNMVTKQKQQIDRQIHDFKISDHSCFNLLDDLQYSANNDSLPNTPKDTQFRRSCFYAQDDQPPLRAFVKQNDFNCIYTAPDDDNMEQQLSQSSSSNYH